MDILLIAILLYLSIKRILDLLDIGIQWYAHYRDDKQAIAKAVRMDAEYSNISEEGAHDEWLSFAKRHGISTEE